MKIAIYGGSFNPPHLGHAEAVHTVCRELRPDKFLIIPASIPPHKELEEGSPDAGERMTLCKLAFGDIPGVEISAMEMNREGRSYSADTIDILRGQNPGAELYLVVGTDMFLSFRQWYRYQHLLECCTLTVLSREEDDEREILDYKEGLEAEGAKTLLLRHEPLPMSSSDIRACLRRGQGADMLADAVYERIIKMRDYDALPELVWLRKKAQEYLTADRIAHTAGCESEAVMLAKRWGEDPEKAAAAGILHDITKKLSYDEQLILCEKYGIILDNAEKNSPKLLHAPTGAALARDRFGVSDEIYEAIRWHTTGKPDMTLLEKIIYLADYIEPTRDFSGVEELRALAYEDINKAMARGLAMSLEDIRARNIEPHRHSIEAFLWYSAEQNND